MAFRAVALCLSSNLFVSYNLTRYWPAQLHCKTDVLIAHLTLSTNYKPVSTSHNESLNIPLILAVFYPFWAQFDATFATSLVVWIGPR